MSNNEIQHQLLLDELNQIIQSGRNNILLSVNSTITLVYWQVGLRIQKEILIGDRAAYGKQVIKNASKHLTQQFGSGWGEKHLRHRIRFSEIFSDHEIVSTLCRQLSWSHFKEILYIEDELKLNKNSKKPHQLIKNPDHIEILQMDKSNIRVSEYLTLLPPKEKLLEKLQLAVEIARNSQQIEDYFATYDPL